MSKAYLCDNCGELFSGDPWKTDGNGNDFCPGCTRALEKLGSIDPFCKKKYGVTDTNVGSKVSEVKSDGDHS